MLQTTNGASRRRKPKWDENPLALRPCRFESGLGYHRAVESRGLRRRFSDGYPHFRPARPVTFSRRYDEPVKVRVFALRRVGRRYTHHDQESILGELHLHSIMRGSESHRVAQLRSADPRGSRTEDLLPPLYEPELVAIGHDGLMLRGFESANGTGYVQEWRCVVQR